MPLGLLHGFLHMLIIASDCLLSLTYIYAPGWECDILSVMP